MKQKDFYYSTLYIYDKKLNDSLTADFNNSSERSKSKYLADLIALGLATKQFSSPIFDVKNAESISDKLTAVEKRFEDLQRTVLSDQTEKEVYRALLCNIYFLLDSLVYGEAFNGECLEAGHYDVLPTRLFKQLCQFKEAYRRAA